MKRIRGSVLIFTLWVLVILSILTIVLSYRASSDVKLAKYESYNIKATYLAKAGVIKMLAELAKDATSYDSLNEDWNNSKEFKLGDATVFYGANDEQSRLNLNASTLVNLVTLGIQSALAEKILEYRNTKGVKGFEFMEELFLVEDMTREDYDIIKDFVTIYTQSDSKVNINTASEAVLGAILQDVSVVQDIIEYRQGLDGEEGTDDDGVFRDTTDISSIGNLDPDLFTVSSNIFRGWVKVSFSDDEKIFKSVEAIVDRSGKIYLWKEY